MSSQRKDSPATGASLVEQAAVTAAIAVAGATLPVALSTAVSAGLSVAPDLLRRAAALFKDRSAHRWQIFLEELLKGDRTMDPRLVAQLFAESNDEQVQELLIESARVIAEALAVSVVPVMARLTYTYASKPQPVDKFFRSVRRILTDVTEEEFQDMREIVRRMSAAPFDTPPPWVEIESVQVAPGPGPEARLEPVDPARLKCTGVILYSGQMQAGPSHDLEQAPTNTSRVLHLLQVNGLAQPGTKRWGALLPVSSLIESAIVRRLASLFT